jgi:hypothetical protein
VRAARLVIVLNAPVRVRGKDPRSEEALKTREVASEGGIGNGSRPGRAVGLALASEPTESVDPGLAVKEADEDAAAAAS